VWRPPLRNPVGVLFFRSFLPQGSRCATTLDYLITSPSGYSKRRNSLRSKVPKSRRTLHGPSTRRPRQHPVAAPQLERMSHFLPSHMPTASMGMTSGKVVGLISIKSIMITAGQYANAIFSNLINQTMLLVDSLRPATRQFVLQRFGFAFTAEWIPLALLNQFQNAQSLLTVLANPICQIFDRRKVKFQLAFGLHPRKFPAAAVLPPKSAPSWLRFSKDKRFPFPIQSRATTRSARSR